MNTDRRIAALERAPRPTALHQMTLGELLEQAARVVGQHDDAAAERLRACASSAALSLARAALAAIIGRAIPGCRASDRT